MQRTSHRTRVWVVKSALAIGILAGSVVSQTATERISRFATLLGADKFAYLVWQKQAGDGKPEPYYEGKANSLMFMDTKVGEVKTYKNLGGFWTEPSFTPDGQRIVYYNLATKDIRIMNRDGTGDKSLITGYGMLGDTWRSSDGKQWVVAGRISGASGGDCDYTTQVTVERIEIDNTSNKVALATNAYPHSWEAYDCRPIDWAGLSPDGKYLIGGFPRYGYLGIYNTQASTLTTLTINGCWISMAQDGSNNILYTDEPQGHKGIYIIDINQTQVLKQSVAAALPTNGFYDALRWTPDRNYCTFAAATEQGSFLVPNPRLVHISDSKYAAVNDNGTGSEGNMDVFFYGSSTVITQPAHAVARASTRGQGRAYDLRGRCIARQAGQTEGVLFFRTAIGTADRASIVIRAQ